jgi:hypothetical protein
MQWKQIREQRNPFRAKSTKEQLLPGLDMMSCVIEVLYVLQLSQTVECD